MKLNAVGKLAVGGYVAVTGYQLYKNLRNNGGMQPGQIVSAMLFNRRQLFVVAAVVAVVWFFGRK